MYLKIKYYIYYSNFSKMLPNVKTYLGKRGYILVKKHFDEKLIKEIKKDLTVTPFVNDGYGAEPKSFQVYTENQNKLYMPKFYALEKLGKPDMIRIPDGIDIDLKFAGNLKENQLVPVETCLKALREKGGGILSVGCGFGKTVMAIYIISVLKKKALIIVNKEFLANQWKDRFNTFLPGVRIGIIQQDKVDIEDKDVVIAMLQSISMKEYALNTFDSFGIVISDESHHLSSQVFSRALRKINSKYMLGLTATPNRKDGLTKVFKWYLGDIAFSLKDKRKHETKVERLLMKSNNEYYMEELLNFRGKPRMAEMINNITRNMHRTKVIVHWIKELFGEGRKILVLSDRREHLQDFFNLIDKSLWGKDQVGYYVGGMKQKNLDISATKRVILGTYHIASEGLDLPDLDTLILASPRTDIVQSVGRIFRKKHEEIQPKIIDVVENFSMFESQAKKRLTLYRQREWKIEDISVWDEMEGGRPKIDKRKMNEFKKRGKGKEEVDTKSQEDKFKQQFSGCMFGNLNN